MRVDAHQHIWDPARGDYGWLTPDLTPLYRPFLPDELAPQMSTANIESAVWVQAAPTEAETDWLLSLARSRPSVLGVVGWLDLDAPNFRDRLTQRTADPLFVGVRPMLQDLAEREWILAPERARAISALENSGVVFDALVRPDQLPVVAELARCHTDLRIVLNHAGKPEVTTAGPEYSWLQQIEQLAHHDNVICKYSGLLGEKSAADALMLRPYVQHLLDCFGGERLIWGSDWPVLTLFASFSHWVSLSDALIPETHRDAVFGDNARRIYTKVPRTRHKSAFRS